MYMQQLFVIKIGGNVIDDELALQAFLHDFAAIDGLKYWCMAVARLLPEWANSWAFNHNYINGRRITDDATIDLVTMVYGGLVNKKIVAQLQAFGCNAIGLTGADANLIAATKRPVKEVDFGWVGDMGNDAVNATCAELVS